MKTLLKNYINLLTIEKVKKFSIKNNIFLSDEEISFLINLIKDNYDEIIIDDTKYLEILKSKLSNDNFIKIRELYTYYKIKYKDYLV